MAVAVTLAACEQGGYSECGALVCPAGYQCMGNQCVTGEQIAACVDHEEDAECGATGLDGRCRQGYCQVDMCGNAQLDTYPVRGPEVCDGDLGVPACSDAGFDFGQTTCTVACTADTSQCKSFGWLPASSGQGFGRVVAAVQDSVFLARGNLLSWARDGKTWRNAQRITAIGDVIPMVIPMGMQQGLVVAAGATAMKLKLWHFVAPTTLTDTGLEIDVVTQGQWRGGVQMTATALIGAVGADLYVFRAGTPWTATKATLVRNTCAAMGNVDPMWRAAANVVYGAISNELVRLTIAGDTITCATVSDLSGQIVAIGGSAPTLGWAVTNAGYVYNGAGIRVSSDPLERRPITAAVGPATSAPTKLWAVSGDDIVTFEGGMWWTSSEGAAVLPDDFGGRVTQARPLALAGDRVLAIAAVQEAGLAELAEREWMLGWENTTSGEVTDMAIRPDGEPWAALQSGGLFSLAQGSRIRSVTGLANPIVSMTFVGNTLYAGAANGAFRIDTTAAMLTAVREGTNLGSARGIWADGTTLYTASGSGATAEVRTKEAGAATAWAPAVSLPSCGAIIAASGRRIADVPTQFVVCRTGAERTTHLHVTSGGAVVKSVLLPDKGYTRVAADETGVVWLVGTVGTAIRVPPPYEAAQVLPVVRRSPVTGKVVPISDALNDIATLPNGDVFVAGGNQSLFWWDGARLVRVTPSQRGGAIYVALANAGNHLYAAHEAGVDLLLHRAP